MSLAIVRRVGKDQNHACQIHGNEKYLVWHGWLPPNKKEQSHGQYTLLDNQSILLSVRKYLAAQGLGKITPHKLCWHVHEVICPALGLAGNNATISEHNAVNWLYKLGYSYTEVQKGLYFVGHERPDVIKVWVRFLEQMKHYKRCTVEFGIKLNMQADFLIRFMYTYDDKIMEPIVLELGPGEKLHIFLTRDECYVHVLENAHHQWLAKGQQPL